MCIPWAVKEYRSPVRGRGTVCYCTECRELWHETTNPESGASLSEVPAWLLDQYMREYPMSPKEVQRVG